MKLLLVLGVLLIIGFIGMLVFAWYAIIFTMILAGILVFGAFGAVFLIASSFMNQDMATALGIVGAILALVGFVRLFRGRKSTEGKNL